MLATLRQHHHDLLELMQTMERLISLDELLSEEVTRTRLLLGKASAARTRFLGDAIYPTLLASLDGATAAQVRQLQDEATSDRARSSAHVGKWNTASIKADWQGFRRASEGILSMMAKRIDRERLILYPLLSAGALRRKGPASD